MGEVHPEVVERFDLTGWPAAALELDPALCLPDPEPRFEPFVNVPAVARAGTWPYWSRSDYPSVRCCARSRTCRVPC